VAKSEFSWAILRVNLVFFGGLILWTALFLPFAFLAWSWQVSVKGVASRMSIRNLVQCYGVVCCKLLGSQVRVQTDNLAAPLPRPCIIAANHQSFFDPYCIGFFSVFAPTFIVRAWPFRIPLYGRIMRRAGYLNIEELDEETLLLKAGTIMREGATLVVFPEGTRSATGELGRFRSGAFKLAMECDVPIVPMCINGTGRVFPRGTRFGRPTPMAVTLLPPIYPVQFRNYGKLSHLYLRKSVKRAIYEKLKSQIPYSTFEPVQLR
jgi:1-acyl-sn-glycerol-3-phosphate acyltransferase